MESNKRKRTFGVLGSVIGLVALVATVLHFFFGPIAEPKPVESFVAETAVNIKDAIKAKIKGEKYQPPTAETSIDADLIVERGTISIALLAVSLGVFGFLRHEEKLPNGLALGLGGATVAFSVSIAITSIIIGIILIAAIISALGLDFGL